MSNPTHTRGRLVEIRRHPHGPRLYVVGLRVHHGLTGCGLAAAGAIAAAARMHVLVVATVTIAGLAMALEDLHDFPWPTHDVEVTL